MNPFCLVSCGIYHFVLIKVPSVSNNWNAIFKSNFVKFDGSQHTLSRTSSFKVLSTSNEIIWKVKIFTNIIWFLTNFNLRLYFLMYQLMTSFVLVLFICVDFPDIAYQQHPWLWYLAFMDQWIYIWAQIAHALYKLTHSLCSQLRLFALFLIWTFHCFWLLLLYYI